METTIDNNGVEHVIIEREDGSVLSMPKSVYDEQQAAQVEHLTEIPTSGD